uniref:Uncharacterized protein n=1 Tax=Panagrolaimus sp. PS1159 TaxID=55785 RepID=A0AC35GIG4_9BILA
MDIYKNMASENAKNLQECSKKQKEQRKKIEEFSTLLDKNYKEYKNEILILQQKINEMDATMEANIENSQKVEKELREDIIYWKDIAIFWHKQCR